MKAFLFIALFCHIVLTAYPQAGMLDSTFDFDGELIMGTDTSSETCTSLIVQPDGKILSLGSYHSNELDGLLLLRYNTDGTADSAFGTGGIAIIDFGESGFSNSIALQQDGKILIPGKRFNGTDYEIAVCRINDNGTIDSTFGESGIASIFYTGGTEYVNAVSVTGEGKIAIAGYISGNTNDLFLARFDSAGIIDTTFGNYGIASMDADSGLAIMWSMAIDTEDRIVVAGIANTESQNGWDMLVARFLQNGLPDSSFDSDGRKYMDFNSNDDYAKDVAILPDNRIVLAGFIDDSSFDWRMTIILLKENGSLDSSFSNNGVLSMYPNWSQAYAVAVQPDLKIVSAGRVLVGQNILFAMIRCLPDGTLDNSFGVGGMVTHQAYPHSDNFTSSVALAPDGKIVAGGYYVDGNNGSGTDVFLLRYLSDFAVHNNDALTSEIFLNIFPNPSPDIVTIQFAVSGNSNASIEITDLSGKIIETIAKGNFEKGNHELIFAVKQLAAGMYLLRFSAAMNSGNNNVEVMTKKLIIE